MQSREREIEMRMGGEGTEGDREKGNLGGAVDWDGGGGRKEKKRGWFCHDAKVVFILDLFGCPF